MSELLTILLPAVAVAALRAGDVTLNVFRTVFTVQGRKGLAALAHGLEAGVWLVAAGIALSDLTPPRMAGFVAGVMLGTWIGMAVIERLRLGTVTVRAYADATHDPDIGLRMAKEIHAAGFGATMFNGHGYRGPVQMTLSTVRRRDADTVMGLVRTAAPEAFVSIDNGRYPAPAAVRP